VTAAEKPRPGATRPTLVLATARVAVGAWVALDAGSVPA
jgi:hypothetical protein